ncbi:caspase family protein [Nocardia takedensis]
MPTDYSRSRAAGPRRFLIAAAVAEHTHGPHWDRPGLVAARVAMVELFTETFGYALVDTIGSNPTAAQLLDALDAFCTSPDRRPDDIVAVYFTGHGERLPHTDAHVLFTADTHPDRTRLATTTAAVAHRILYETPVRRVLLMLDTCYSGKGGADFTTTALDDYTHHWDETPGNGIAVISSAQPHQSADAGQFPRLFAEAAASLSTAGFGPETIAVQALVTKMNNLAADTPWQVAGSSEVLLIGEAPPFLPNPRHDRRLHEVDLAVQQAAQWEEHTQRRRVEFQDRMLVRAMGDSDGTQWWFRGRHTALTDITTWLHNPDPAHPLLAVTADPGSGKTAVLGVIAAMAHPEYHRTVPTGTLGFPPEAVPAIGAVDVVIYAQNLTLDQVRDGIAAAAKLTAATVGELLDDLSVRPRGLTVLIDGLDEAADPHQLVRDLLRPLLDHTDGRIRLLIGTRSYLLAELGTDRDREIDLDAHRYADPEAMSTYIMRGLIDSTLDSVYLHQDGATVRAVADAVTDAAYPSFLVARIVAATLASDPTVPDPWDREWRRCLPALPGEAMRRDLDTRLGTDARRARDLLRPLAFAQGQGLPWEDLWAAVASALAGATYTDADLMWLRRTAGSYVVESTENGRSAYRLYHQALAEHLAHGSDSRAAHSIFVQVLRRRVAPTSDGHRDWARAHPYILVHVAAHAAHAGLVDDLVADSDYLVHAEPAGLLDALHFVTTEAALLTRAVYRCSADLHRYLSPVRRRRLLAIDAARFGVTDQQADLNKGQEWQVRWATGGQTDHALRTTMTGYDKYIYAVACSSVDRRPIAVTVGSFDNAARVWDLTTGAESFVLGQAGNGAYSVACTSIEGRAVAVTGHGDSTVRVWDLRTGAELATLTGHTSSVFSVACTSVDGRPVAVTGGGDDTVRVWDLATGAELAGLTGHTSTVRAVQCTDFDGRPVAVTGGHGDPTRIWDLGDNSTLTVHSDHTSPVEALGCASIDGRPVAATTAHDERVRVWDLSTGRTLAVLTGHTDTVKAVACTSIDGQAIAVTGSADRTVRVWDLGTGNTLAVLTGHTETVKAVACTSIDGRPVAVTASDDQTVRVWDLRIDAARTKSVGHTSPVTSVTCTNIEGRPVAVTASDDRTARVWDLSTGTTITVLSGHTSLVKEVGCTTVDDRPVAVTASHDGTARVWDLRTGTELSILRHPNAAVYSVGCTTVDGLPVAVTVTHDSAVRLWNLDTATENDDAVRILHAGNALAVLTGYTDTVNTVACASIGDSPIAVTSSTNDVVRIWDLGAGAALAVHRGEGRIVSVACAVLDDRPVAIVGFDGHHDVAAEVWQLPTNVRRARTSVGRLLRRRPIRPRAASALLPHLKGAVTSASLAGRPVAICAARDRSIRVWDLTTMTVTVVIDCPLPPRTVACWDSTIVVGFGNDLAVLTRSTPRSPATQP